MQSRHRSILVAAAIAACSSFTGGCHTLAAPQSDDGSLPGGATNPNPSVSYSISNQSPKVGESVVVTVTANGQPVATNTSSVVSSSDQGVLYGQAAAFRAVAVGKSTIQITYGSFSQSQVVNVSPSADGMQAYIYIQGTQTYGIYFAPPSVSVKAGSMVEFKFPDLTHNVTFSGATGAPTDVAVGNLNPIRMFANAGTYTYVCSVHGESGVISVVP